MNINFQTATPARADCAEGGSYAYVTTSPCGVGATQPGS